VTAPRGAPLSAPLARENPLPRAGDPLPPLWHWLYFLPLARQSEIGLDGHAKRGGFLPPVPLPRRGGARSQFQLHRPLKVGDSVRRTSKIESVSEKSGRSGRLVFVKVKHEIRSNGSAEPPLSEIHDIVYRDAPKPGDAAAPPQPAPPAKFEKKWIADDVLLFRYS